MSEIGACVIDDLIHVVFVVWLWVYRVSGVCLFYFLPSGTSLPLLFHSSGWLGVECDDVILT
jgi:hypothetical protein